jgi:hypothetical protein
LHFPNPLHFLPHYVCITTCFSQALASSGWLVHCLNCYINTGRNVIHLLRLRIKLSNFLSIYIHKKVWYHDVGHYSLVVSGCVLVTVYVIKGDYSVLSEC